MFGRKTKRIKDLEKLVEQKNNSIYELVEKNLFLKNERDNFSKENNNLRLHNGRLMNEVSKLQSQVQRVGLVRNAKGQMESLK